MNDALVQDASPESIRAAVSLLAKGELVGIPTETVYGLAADATNAAAVTRIYNAKGRPANNPLIVHVPHPEAAEKLVGFEGHPWLRDEWNAATSLWPGPLTFVVPRSDQVLDEVTAGMTTVAIRVPSHPITRMLLDACPFPLAAPSANVSNYISPTTALHVAQGLSDHLSLVIDGGACESGVESTIVELTANGPRLLRPGGVSAEKLREVFGELRVDAKPRGETDALPAPGMLPKHYSPSKKMVFLEGSTMDPKERVGRLAFQPLSAEEAGAYHRVWTLSETGDLHEVARNLFAVMRDADSSDCDLLVIDRCAESGIGRAIMNRLNRAVAK